MELALLVLLALVVGGLMPTQAGINALLRTHVLSPYTAALISFFVGTVALFIWCLLVRVPVPGMRVFGETPWWQWFGGTMGAVIVAGSIILAPKLGATSMLALMVAGQMFASLYLDHFGMLGFPVHEMSLPRIFGCLLVIGGVVLIQRF
ncbi:MAG: DMT family transporter [Desulfovibrionales bacterium]